MMIVKLRAFRMKDGSDAIIASDPDHYIATPTKAITINNKDDLIRVWNDNTIAWWALDDFDFYWHDRNCINVIEATVEI